MKLLSFICLVFISVQPSAQYCINVGPSSSADSNLESLTLWGESGTFLSYSGCPGVVGLDDETSTTNVILAAGNSYTINAQFGTCGGNYAGIGEGWIDYNQNSIFEPSESVGIWSGTPPTAMSVWNFSVPVGAITGTTRMRVMLFEGGVFPLDPCASFTWGSVTDFTVQISGGMDCSGYVGQNIDNPRIINSIPFNENHSNSVCYFNNLTVYNSPDVFYQITPSQLELNWVTISTCGSAMDTYLSVLDKTGQIIYYNDDNCGTSSLLHFNAGNYDTLYVVVQGYGNLTGNYMINVQSNVASISEEYLDLKIYPNPADNFLFVETRLENVTYEILDLTGKLISDRTALIDSKIEIQHLASGLYLCQFYYKDTVKVIQFIKN